MSLIHIAYEGVKDIDDLIVRVRHSWGAQGVVGVQYWFVLIGATIMQLILKNSLLVGGNAALGEL